MTDSVSGAGVLAFGNAVMDAIAFVSDDFASGAGLLSGSVSHLSRMELEGLLSLIHEPLFVSGGSAANAVKIASTLGLPCAFSGAIGCDTLGTLFKADLCGAGVSCELAVKDARTGLVLSMIDPGAVTTIAAERGAAAEFSPDDIPTGLFSRYPAILIEGYLLYNRELFDFILDRGAREGSRFVFDVSSRQLAESARGYILDRVIPRLSLLFMNEDELKALSGSGFEDSLGFLSRLSCTSIVKFGERGAASVCGGIVERVPAPLAKVRDVTGCGDAFLGGYLYAESQKCGIRGCLEAGSAAAFHVLGVPGTRIDPERLERSVKTAVQSAEKR